MGWMILIAIIPHSSISSSIVVKVILVLMLMLMIVRMGIHGTVRG